MGRPWAVAWPTPGLPAQHRRVEGNCERCAERAEQPFWVGEDIIGIDDRRRMAEPVGFPLEELGLTFQPEVPEFGGIALTKI